MKKLLSLLLLLLMLLTLILPLTSCDSGPRKFYLYNWGEYMPLGDDDSLNIPELFEAYYLETYGEEIEVIYSIYASNEDLYAKMKMGSAKIDLIIPSDYMAARLITEDYLAPLDFDKIPHFENIADKYKNPDYDTENAYTVPFTVGLVGLIYNTERVREEDFPTDEDGNVSASWRLLWDEHYAGNFLTFNNSRDAFGVAQYLLSAEKGHTGAEDNYVNTADKSRWDESLSLLLEQKPLVQAYVMDEVFNKMESGSAAMAPYYAGDFYTMQENNESLAFVYPKEGTNIFADAFCIPKASKNSDIATAFIDFALMTDAVIEGEEYNIAKEIAEYICYATPNEAVTQDPEYEYFEDPILYPELSPDYPTYYFRNLDPETLDYVNSLWEQLKIDSSSDLPMYLIALAIVLVTLTLAVFLFVRKKKREKYY